MRPPRCLLLLFLAAFAFPALPQVTPQASEPRPSGPATDKPSPFLEFEARGRAPQASASAPEAGKPRFEMTIR